MKLFYVRLYLYICLRYSGSSYIWVQLRKQNIGPASFGLGPQICYTSILSFLFHYRGEKKIVVNFP